MAAHVSAEAVVPCRADRAATQLVAVLGAPNELPEDPVSVTITVGPRRRYLLHKRVRAQMTAAHDDGRTSVFPLRWRPTGRLGRLYPVLHARLAVTAIDDTSCLLSVDGDYTPPLGHTGLAVDHAGLHRIATSTVQDFTTRLARTIGRRCKEESR